MCAGSHLAICAAKKYNHISLILYARGANVNWSKPRICFVIQSVYHYILYHYWKKTKINTKYRFCKSDVRKILLDECTTIQSAFCQNRRIFRQGKSPLLSAKKGGEGRECKQMGDKPRFWTGGGGTGKNGENIMKQETAKKAIGQSAKFLLRGKECAALFPVAGYWKMRLQQKNLPPGGFSGFF